MTKPSANAKAYFRYHFRKQLPYLLLLTLSALIFTVLFLFEEADHGIDAYTNSLFYLPAVFLSLFSFITPLVELAPFKNRRNLDLWYAMPIHRRTLLSVHLAVGLIDNLIMHAVSFFTVFFFWLPHASYFRLSYAFPLYGLSLLCGIVMYLLSAFLFYEGNTVLDGFMTQLFGAFALPMTLFSFTNFFYEFALLRSFLDQLSTIITHLFFFSPINDLTTIFQGIIECERVYGRSDNTINHPSAALQEFFTDPVIFLSLLFFLLLAIASLLGFYKKTYDKPLQTIGEVTTSFFSYRLMLPLYGFSLAFFASSASEGVILPTIFWVLTFFMYLLYRRTFRLKIRDWVTLLLLLFVSAILAFV